MLPSRPQPHHLHFKPVLPPLAEWNPQPSRFKGLEARHAHLPMALRREFYQLGASTGCHAHLDFLALYVVRGGGGVHCIDRHPYGLARGDVYLMSPGAAHEYRDFKNLEIEAIYFQPEIFTETELGALRGLPGFWKLFVGEAGVDHRLHLSPENYHQIDGLLEGLRTEWWHTDSTSALLLRHALFKLLVALARLMTAEAGPNHGPSSGPNSGPTPGHAAIAQVVRYLDAHFEEPLSVAQLAAQLFLSPGHFSELFKQEMGVPPATYLRNLRLEKARALLREGQLSVRHIAERTGFVDAPHFSRTFRAHYNQTPLTYRKQFGAGARTK